MKKKLIETLKVLFFLSIGLSVVLFVWYNMAEKDRSDFWVAISKADYKWVAATILLGSLAHMSRAVRWRLIIEPFGYHPKKRNLFFAVMNMYFFNMAVPRLGEITRCAILQRYEKIPFEKTFGTVVAERAVDMIMLLIMIGVTAVFQLDHIDPILASILEVRDAETVAAAAAEEPSFFMKNLKFILLGALALGFGILYLLRNNPFFGKIFLKVRNLAKGFWEGLKAIRKVKNPKEFIFHTLFIWVMYFLMTWVCFFTLPETSNVSPLGVLTVLVFGSIAITVIPGGIGAFPLIVAAILKLDFFGGIDYGTGWALGWIIWGAQTLLVLLLGTISIVLLPIFNRKKT